MLNGLDLFSGIGGMSFALRGLVKPLAYCEIDPYCQGVLLSRMADESICNSPIWDDIKTLDGTIFQGSIDIVYAGFPCQDISIAGTKKGLSGERSTLVFDLLRVVEQVKPKFLFIENVPNIVNIGANTIVEKIDKMGMDCRWACISAESCGAPHKRDRWFMLAYNNCQPSWETYPETEPEQTLRDSWIRYSRRFGREIPSVYWKENQYPLIGMDDGLQNELDRAKSLGNSVVPQQARQAFKILMGFTTST